jgi:hypothetical protein
MHVCVITTTLFSFNEESLHGSDGGYQEKQDVPSALPAKEFLLPKASSNNHVADFYYRSDPPVSRDVGRGAWLM